MNKEIKIIDMPMGEGKTTGLINYMNNNPQNKYLFITPFLDEIKRIRESCPELKFKEPDDKYSKLSDLKKLISDGENIASTHALFSIVDDNVINLLYMNGYNLILDEVLEIIEPLEIAPKDLKLLISGEVIKVAEDGRVSVIDNSYKGKGCRFTREINAIKNQNVYLIDDTLLLCLFNFKAFSCFESVSILTYMFEGSLMKSYFDLYSLEYEYYHISDNEIVKGKFDDSSFRTKVKSLINIYDGRLNNVGQSKTSLCTNWQKDGHKKEEHKILKNNIYNYFRNVVNSSAEYAMWSTVSGCNDNIKNYYAPKSYTKGCFVPCNIRATNNYINKKDLVYAVNVFLNPFVVKYFARNNIKLDGDNYALSQILQWIWRSRIRNDEQINIYIPSKRMRDLLLEYLNK